MNHSIHSADRALHLKILVVALLASIAVAGLAVGARVSHQTTARTIQAGQPVMMSSAAIAVTR